MIKKVLIILFLIFCIALLGVYFYVQQQIDSPAAQNKEKILLEIKPGSSLLSIASQLEQKRIIKNKFVFILHLIIEGRWSHLKAGNYSLESSMTPRQIAQKLLEGEEAKVIITIPEGFSLEQIEERLNSSLEKTFSVTSVRAEDYQDKFSFLNGVPKQKTLEGFLMPDTYYFSPDASSGQIIKRMLANFEAKAVPLMPDKEAESFDMIIMASLLEKEVTGLEDKKIVSDILWKRLEIGMPLQVDATIVYITGKKTTTVSKKETEIDSSYNTYKYKGLPAGPICNPGTESIEAAAWPQESEYWYYLTTKEGETIFSKTFEEHNYNKNKYLNQ